MKISKRKIDDSIRYKVIDGVKCKICLECEGYFPMTNEYFYNNKSNKKDGLNTYCIPCTFKRAGKWVDNNPEKYKEQKLRKVANKTDIQRQRSRDSARKNRIEGKHKEWRKNHPGRLSEYGKDRRKRKKHKISKKEWNACKEYFNNECAYCGLKLSDHHITWNDELKQMDFAKEHVNDNGENDLSNCVPSCRSCNSKKWKHEFEDWYRNRSGVFDEVRYNKIIKWLKEDYRLYIKVKLH